MLKAAGNVTSAMEDIEENMVVPVHAKAVAARFLKIKHYLINCISLKGDWSPLMLKASGNVTTWSVGGAAQQGVGEYLAVPVHVKAVAAVLKRYKYYLINLISFEATWSKFCSKV